MVPPTTRFVAAAHAFRLRGDGAEGGAVDGAPEQFSPRPSLLHRIPFLHYCFWRTFTTELKGTNLKDLYALGGWKSAQTILTCYMQADEESMREALGQRKRLTVMGV